MTIDDLKKITAVIETGSINRASEKLFTAQPAISRSIKRVEEEYNITLFARTQGKKAELTEEGRMFYNAAQEIIATHEKMIRQLESYKLRNESTIRFGTPPQQSVFLFGEMLKWFYRNVQSYQLETHAASSRQLHMQVLNGELDIALINVAEKYDNIYYEKEKRMHTNVYLSSKSPLHETKKYIEGLETPVIDVHDLEKDTIIVNKKGSASRDVFDRLVEKYHLNVKIIEEDTSMYKRMKMADDGIASYLLSSAASSELRPDWARGTIDRYVLIDPEQDVETWRYIICRKGFENTEKYRVLKKCLKETES